MASTGLIISISRDIKLDKTWIEASQACQLRPTNHFVFWKGSYGSDFFLLFANRVVGYENFNPSTTIYRVKDEQL
jgi:hypothetical protein